MKTNDYTNSNLQQNLHHYIKIFNLKYYKNSSFHFEETFKTLLYIWLCKRNVKGNDALITTSKMVKNLHFIIIAYHLLLSLTTQNRCHLLLSYFQKCLSFHITHLIIMLILYDFLTTTCQLSIHFNVGYYLGCIFQTHG